MTFKRIPSSIQQEAIAIVERFNQETLQGNPNVYYVPRFKGAYLHLDRTDWGGPKPHPVCRLEWTGEMANWKFAIYRFSKNFYDPDEWMFPGVQHVNGTIEGAMKAGMEAYPP